MCYVVTPKVLNRPKAYAHDIQRCGFLPPRSVCASLILMYLSILNRRKLQTQNPVERITKGTHVVM